MGTLKSANPVHFDNGITYRVEKQKLDMLFHKNDRYCLSGDMSQKAIAHKANDLLLAKLAILQAVVLTNNLSLSDKNETAIDFSEVAINSDRFCHFFDHLMKQQRGY